MNKFSAAGDFSRASVIALIRSLVTEVQGGGTDWENSSLESYLEALGGWLEDCEGYYRNTFGTGLPDSQWRIIHDALSAARSYE